MRKGSMKTIGLIVNPVAGMGGAVGLKGTDGDMYQKALTLGAEPVTPQKTRTFLRYIQNKDQIRFLSGPGRMGADILSEFDFPYQVIGETASGMPTHADDTVRICRQMAANDAVVIVFVGGDGTARNIYDAIGSWIPVVGVPAGVKIFSGVFAVNAESAAQLVDFFIEGSPVSEEEVLDIDEDAYRLNHLQSRLYGYLQVPKAPGYIQHSKSASSVAGSELENKYDVAEWMAERMEAHTLYLLGPGTTVKSIADFLGLEKTLLGIDAYYEGGILQQDLNEREILELLDEYPQRKIVVTPIGGNGFIFGRGNKQFTPQVIRKVGLGNILIVSTKDKISGFVHLHVDTGDEALDREFLGFQEVVIGYHESRMVKVVGTPG